MKNLNIFKHLRIISLLLCAISIHSIVYGQEPIKPLTQVNKNFLIVAQIVLDPTGTSTVDTNAIKSVFLQLNTLFKPISVSFTICEFRYISNFQYYNLPEPRENELPVTYMAPKRINVFFVSSVVASFIAECGNAYLGGITSQAVIVITDPCIDVSTIGHEMGHCFNLLHTFETINGKELVNESNCTTAGDGLCDTPADPYVSSPTTNMSDYVNSNCLFIGQQTDANGQYYNPDIGNIMSYYRSCNCVQFTHDQYERMARYYLSNPVAW